MTAIDPPHVPGLEVDRFRSELHAIYAALDAEVAALAPRCELSGRCCRFREYGHTLFISAPEAALLLDEAESTSRQLDDGATCPWQNGAGLCTARNARPLGCRVYFCDPSFQEHLSPLSERYLTRLKSLAQRLNLPWNYAPLHVHLCSANEEGRFPRPRDRVRERTWRCDDPAEETMIS